MKLSRLFLFSLSLSLISLTSMAQDESEKERAERIRQEVDESMKKAEKEMQEFYERFDDVYKEDIQKSIEQAMKQSEEAMAMWQQRFVELDTEQMERQMQSVEEQFRRSAENMGDYFQSFHNSFNDYGFNEYFSEWGHGKEVLIRREVNGEVEYEKIVNGKLGSISQTDIDELEAIFKNDGNATGKEKGEIIKIDSNTSSTSKDGNTEKSNTLKVYKRINGC